MCQLFAHQPQRDYESQTRSLRIDGQRQIFRRHAVAIVGDADPPPPATIGENVDPARPGVDGVFHQFLDHARRPLDHLAGGDAVDDLFGKLADRHDCGTTRGSGKPI